ncbi:hypothetical protein A1O7_04819 [Cladophialophora yegresii CBS 114405]|uniref:ceramidase n=1 Tax=Cladophialophora yegresii CBS 114405 TaxID=1182544 RepID=W9W807_9EURO|nr:uncharacterized protein A1O7_04819 [Cladophialophora yegresii CBS 114405]EXJ60666.1 hypothetical protein A1O7_04819 [Cladophialophora yegresii CBS 114405]
MDTSNGVALIAPVHTIDLSLQPEDRYKALALAYADELRGLTTLFNALLGDLGLSQRSHGPINLFARMFLRGLNSPVETAELRGIAQVTGVPMYLLVSFNVVLDCLMGCTSGAVKTLEKGEPWSKTRMLHFRTLDWSMDPLRRILVRLEFVRSRSATPGQILARSVTYVGFIGVLTGVREDLSVSLNFRPLHNATRRRDHMRFYLHHLLVLLGYRQSIAGILREYIIPEDPKNEHAKRLEDIMEEVIPRPTTAAYLTFCDGVSTVVLEKDYGTAVMRYSDTFIGVTNNDQDDDDPRLRKDNAILEQISVKDSGFKIGMEALVEESRDRLDAIAIRWRGHVRKAKRQAKKDGKDASTVERNLTVTTDEVIEWLSAYPTTNEQTHFATIMDPMSGQVVWTRVYPPPLE